MSSVSGTRLISEHSHCSVFTHEVVALALYNQVAPVEAPPVVAQMAYMPFWRDAFQQGAVARSNENEVVEVDPVAVESGLGIAGLPARRVVAPVAARGGVDPVPVPRASVDRHLFGHTGIAFDSVLYGGQSEDRINMIPATVLCLVGGAWAETSESVTLVRLGHWKRRTTAQGCIQDSLRRRLAVSVAPPPSTAARV